MRASRILVCLAVLVWFSGCVAQRPRHGTVHQPALGRHFLDFFFEDERGRSVSLGDSLGDFTVLAFTRCDDNTHVQPTRLLETMVNDHRGDAAVRVRGIDIHWTESECSTHKSCHLLRASRDTLSICDATGMIHTLYGATKTNELFLIGPDRRVIGRATMAYPEGLRHQLAIDVTRFRARLYETRPDELSEKQGADERID